MYSRSIDAARPWAILFTGILLAAALLAVSLYGYNKTFAQDGTIEYAENGKDPVATFEADDPEGATSITWSLATDDSIDGVETADVADNASFSINEDGELSFTAAPDFENPADTNATDNTYKVVVVASDLATGGQMGYHKVTVKVTNEDEPGTVSLATDTTNGTPQYLVGATLTANASDGDITNADQAFTTDRAGEVTGVTWRWFRGDTEITGADAQDNTYTLVAADADEDIRAVVYYIVTGNVDQEQAEKTTDYPVLAARVGANALKFDPAAVSRTISEGAKDRNVGAPVTATGNHGTVRYSLADSGDALASAPKFKIDEKTGQITTVVALNYEGNAGDADNCAATQNSCTVTVIARDSTGDTTTGTAPNLRATVTIKITNVNEEPAFSTGAQTISIPENSTALWDATDTTNYNQDAVDDVTYTAMDPEGLTVSYSLAGPDASKFQLSSDPPVLSFVSGPDFEAKASADRDNVYEVTVRATVGGDTGERMVRVTVGNVDEGPEISGPSTRNFAENGKDPVATYTADDPEGATSITWSLATDASIDGVETADVADNASFSINEDGELSFTAAPDFENPADTNATDNTYKVVVLAADAATGGQTGYHKVTINVTNVSEPGKITLATNTANGTPQYLVGATLTATATDGDITDTDQTFTADRAGEVAGVTWQWYRGGSLIPNETTNAYTLVQADADRRIRAVVTYQVDGKPTRENASYTTDYPVLATRVGANALKFDPATVSRTISEGAKDRNVGAPVTATGNHGTVRYSLDSGGDVANFEIDEKSGQITTVVALNFEAGAGDANNCATRNSCTVTVIARDSTGDTTGTTAPNLNATVTISITNVDEKPAFSTGAETISVPENSAALWHASATGYSVTEVGGVTYTAMDPEGRTVTYSLAGADASKFQLKGSPPVLSFVSAPDFEAKASADRDNVYEVTVRATVGGDTGERMVRVTVGNVDEAPEIMLVPASGLRISGSSSASVAEDDTAVGTYMASGPDAATTRWTLGGADAGRFSISSGGALSFRTAPDFETPGSAAGTNTYSVTVTGTDSEGNSDDIDVTVTVTDVEEQTPANVVDQYDTDNSGRIDKGELADGVFDYEINGTISKDDLADLIFSYEIG